VKAHSSQNSLPRETSDTPAKWCYGKLEQEPRVVYTHKTYDHFFSDAWCLVKSRCFGIACMSVCESTCQINKIFHKSRMSQWRRKMNWLHFEVRSQHHDQTKYIVNNTFWIISHYSVDNDDNDDDDDDDSLNSFGCVMGGAAVLNKMRSRGQRSRSRPDKIRSKSRRCTHWRLSVVL